MPGLVAYDLQSGNEAGPILIAPGVRAVAPATLDPSHISSNTDNASTGPGCVSVSLCLNRRSKARNTPANIRQTMLARGDQSRGM